MKILFLSALCILALLLASCGGGGGADPDALGSINGVANVVGPINGAVELQAGLLGASGDTIIESAVAGRVTSAATASLAARKITYSFTDLELGTYRVAIFAGDPTDPTIYHTSAAQTLTEDELNVTGLSGELSYSGGNAESWGTISGVVQVAGEWPAGLVTFIGVSPASSPQNVLQHIVSEDDINDGKLFYNLEGLAPGTWLVGFYGYNPQTHAVSPYGAEDDPVVINSQTQFITNQNFAADFAGDPGTDPEGATISGTVSFNGALPAGLFYYVAANTIPPQQGAPPSTFEVFSADIVGAELAYSLPFLDDGEYSVSIFGYDITSHTATYFGEAAAAVTIAGGASVEDIDFNADVSLLD